MKNRTFRIRLLRILLLVFLLGPQIATAQAVEKQEKIYFPNCFLGAFVIVVDHSDSQDTYTARGNVCSFLSKATIMSPERNAVFFSLITYNNSAIVRVKNEDRYRKFASVAGAMCSDSLYRGTTNTLDAFRQAEIILDQFDNTKYWRIIFWVSDGDSDSKREVQAIATRIRDKGIAIHTFASGKLPRVEQLKAAAGVSIHYHGRKYSDIVPVLQELEQKKDCN